MKVGLITMHNVCNFGAVLQSYALMKQIENLNGCCEIIDYIPPIRKGLRNYFPNEDLPFYRTLLSWIKWLPVRIGWQHNFHYFMDRYYKDISAKVYRRNISSISDKYDVIVTGSDQVWNSSSTRGVDEAYFLNFAGIKTKKVSYAASISQIKYEKNEDGLIKEYLEDFCSISVRESSIIPELSKLSKLEICQTIDPTVLIGYEFWIDFVRSVKNPCDSKYCLSYILGESKDSDALLKNIAAKKGVKSIKISFKNSKDADIVLKNPSPELFVKLFLEAEYIVTNSLHGCLFSVISKKNFSIPVCVLNGRRFSDFVSTYELDKYSSLSDDGIFMNFLPDYEELDKIINSKRDFSLDFLKKSLNKE